MMTVRIILNERPAPAGKVAEAELHFTSDGGSAPDTDSALHGLKLIGFCIWQTRNGLSVTFPARSYAVNGERRTFALLRPNDGGACLPSPHDRLRDLIIDAYTKVASEAGEGR